MIITVFTKTSIFKYFLNTLLLHNKLNYIKDIYYHYNYFLYRCVIKVNFKIVYFLFSFIIENNKWSDEGIKNMNKDSVYEILERITDGFFAVDKNWNFTYINSEASRLLFRSGQDLIGKNIWQEFPDAMKLSLYENYHRAANKNQPIIFDCYCDSLKIWFDIRAYPSSNGLSIFFRDITKCKMEATQQEEHYKSLFLHNPNAIFSLDLEGNFLSVNPTMEELLGYKEEDFLQRSFIPFVYEADLQRTIGHYKIAASGQTQRYETKVIHKDGTLIYVVITNIPIIVDNMVVGVYGIAKDISSSRKAENELKSKTQQLESYIENNVDAIIILNIHGEVTRVNKAFEELFGWTKEEIMRLTLHNVPLIPKDKVNETIQIAERVKQGQHISGVETTRFRKDGALLDVLLSASPIIDGTEQVIGWSVTLRDITEWKKSQMMLQNADKLAAAGQLAAGIAHEIRNPITSIKGFVHLMGQGFGNSNEYLSIMSSEIERIEGILSELLLLAKPQVGTLELKDMKSLLTQVITLLDAQAILNNVEIITKLQPEVPKIYCDENQLKQVFINFIKNAIEAMSTGGKLVIQTEMVDLATIKIRFIDEGIGMSKETLSQIGLPFYTTKEKGTGLGFMTSRKIIENHFGKLNIISEPGEGTTIEVILPVERGEN